MTSEEKLNNIQAITNIIIDLKKMGPNLRYKNTIQLLQQEIDEIIKS